MLANTWGPERTVHGGGTIHCWRRDAGPHGSLRQVRGLEIPNGAYRCTQEFAGAYSGTHHHRITVRVTAYFVLSNLLSIMHTSM